MKTQRTFINKLLLQSADYIIIDIILTNGQFVHAFLPSSYLSTNQSLIYHSKLRGNFYKIGARHFRPLLFKMSNLKVECWKESVSIRAMALPSDCAQRKVANPALEIDQPPFCGLHFFYSSRWFGLNSWLGFTPNVCGNTRSAHLGRLFKINRVS